MSFVEGRRSAGVGVVHDVDDQRHMVAVDYPTPALLPLDGYRSAWAPGVFAESFRHTPHPPMIYDHRELQGPEFTIGLAVRCESLSDRARVVGQFDEFGRKPMAARAFREIRSGVLPGFSFHFRDGEYSRHPREPDAVVYRRAALTNWGPVRRPAIPGAVATGIRSAVAEVDREELLRLLRRFGVRSTGRDAEMLADFERRQLILAGMSRCWERDVRLGRVGAVRRQVVAELSARAAAADVGELDVVEQIERALARRRSA